MRSDKDLKGALTRVSIPDEQGAEERAWQIVRAAASQRERRTRRPRMRRRGVQAILVAGILGVVISPAGAAVRHWVKDAVQEPGVKRSRAVLTSLPTPGRLLVDSSRGPWIVRPDGSKRFLGYYRQATWSPRGRFVAVTGAHQLTAVDPTGEVRWSLARSGVVHDPAWAPPDGFLVAYLDDHALRVVAGDGTEDRLLRSRVADIPPVWSPAPGHPLAFVDPEGAVEVLGIDDSQTIFRTAVGFPPIQLTWAVDGSRLVVLGKSRADVLDATGRLVRRIPAPAGSQFTTASISPDSRALGLIAVSIKGPRRSQLLYVKDGRDPKSVFTGPGRFTDLVWSPDGGWLLLGWKTADQWLFLSVNRPRNLKAISGIASQFDPGGTPKATFPKIAGWCCPDSPSP